MHTGSRGKLILPINYVKEIHKPEAIFSLSYVLHPINVLDIYLMRFRVRHRNFVRKLEMYVVIKVSVIKGKILLFLKRIVP